MIIHKLAALQANTWNQQQKAFNRKAEDSGVFIQEMNRITALEIEHPKQAVGEYKRLLASRHLVTTGQLTNLVFRLASCLIRIGGHGEALYYFVATCYYLEYLGVRDFNQFDLQINVLVIDLVKQLTSHQGRLHILLAEESRIGAGQIMRKLKADCCQDVQAVYSLAGLFEMLRDGRLEEYEILFLSASLFSSTAELISIVKKLRKEFAGLDTYPVIPAQEAQKLIDAGIGEYMVLESSIRLMYALIPISLEKQYKRLLL